jgi:hypothetical protein
VYVVELEARDRLERSQVVSVDLYAGGEEPVAWQKPTAQGVFKVGTDAKQYSPGSTATLVLESPFQSAQALAIIEAPEGNEYRWVPVRNGSGIVKVAVLGTWAPRVPVHVVLMRGRVPGTEPAPGSRADLGKPATLAATTWLPVDPRDNRVDVKLAHADKARPGEKLELRIDLKDPDGKPLAGEVTLWLVDQAVLALGREQRLDPIPDFVTEMDTRVAVRDTRNTVVGWLPLAELPGGDGAREGASLLDRTTIRKTFTPVPYFNPAIEVGASGTTTVTVQLPDNLTVFKIRAKAASGAQRFGFATSQVAVRLPVIVEPALPRFVRPGDRFVASAIGRIVEGEGGAGKAEAAFEGLESDEDARRAFTWVPDVPQRVDFPVTVATPPLDENGRLTRTEVTVRMSVERSADSARDAFEVELPLREDRGPVRLRVLHDVTDVATVPFPPVAEEPRPGTVQRTVLVSTEPALVRMAAGLDALLEYPFGCTEQRINTTRARVAMRQFRTLLHQEDDVDLERSVAQTQQWIGSAVDPHGLVAYWPGSTGRVSLTAWVVQFLVEARAAGFAVDDALLERLTRSLDQALRSDYRRFIDGESWAERAWALMAMTSAGQYNAAYAAELARKARDLDAESRAQVLWSFVNGGEKSGSVIDSLAKSLRDAVVVRLHQGREIYGGLQDRRALRSGLILPSETRTLGEISRALRALGDDDSRLPVLVQGLVTLGQRDGWGTTNANAAALLALSEVLANARPGAPDVSVEVRFGDTVRSVEVSEDDPVGWFSSQSRLDGAVTVKGGAERAPCAARLETTYVPAADGTQVEAAASGFVVTREWLRIRGEDVAPERERIEQAGSTLPVDVGDVIEEHVQVVNPVARHYVAIVAPLAAGMEPLNPALATAPPEAKPSGTLTLAPSYVAMLDDQAGFFYDTLPAGTYDFYFRTRATVAGRFIQPAAFAELMYDGAVRGTSPGAGVEVHPKAEMR